MKFFNSKNDWESLPFNLGIIFLTWAKTALSICYWPFLAILHYVTQYRTQAIAWCITMNHWWDPPCMPRKLSDSHLSIPIEYFSAKADAEVLKLYLGLARRNDNTGPCPGKTLVHSHFVGLGLVSLRWSSLPLAANLQRLFSSLGRPLQVSKIHILVILKCHYDENCIFSIEAIL